MKGNFSKKLIPIIVVAILFYTIAAFVLQFYNGMEISPTLTGAYFTFWTIEIVSLASIKNVKTKKKLDNKENNQNEMEE